MIAVFFISFFIGLIATPIVGTIFGMLVWLGMAGRDLVKLGDKLDANERAASEARRDIYRKWDFGDDDDWD
jgi:hypothetical protein